MRNHLTFVTLLGGLLFGTALFSQPAPPPSNPPLGLITGKVLDAESGLPIEFATISLFHRGDSSLVTGGITDAGGVFEIEAPAGQYFLKVEFISYEPFVIPEVVIGRGHRKVDLGVIHLQIAAQQLQEVEVRAEKSTLQISLDKKVFNVGKDLANRGGTAEDLLDNVPSVTVDIEGNVSLRGSGNVRLLVDGKPSGLVSGASGLRQLPANMIDRIEVITNPSARYEAEGMAGIINIVLRKQQNKGVNGSFDFTLGQPSNYGAAINLNWRRKKVNLFTNYGLSYRKHPGQGSLFQETLLDDTLRLLQQTREHERGGLSNNIRLGADYFLSPKDIFTTSFLYRFSKEDNNSELRYRDYLFSLENPTLLTLREDDESEDESNLEYALSYKHQFEGEGHELTADVRFIQDNETESSDFTESYFLPDGAPTGGAPLLQRSNNEEGTDELILQADYVRPFGKDHKFEAGYRSSFRRIRNDYLVEEFNDVEWTVLDGLSNNFEYDEIIHAAYAIYGNKVKRFSYQAGLRYEFSDVTTHLIQTDELNARQYGNLFPSLHLSYELLNQNAIQLSYSRRLRRPRFWDLNPFFTFSDNRNFFSGNPNLDPEFTDSYEIGHIKYWEKASLSSALFYRHTTDVIERVRTLNPDGTTTMRPENLLTRDDYGLEFNFSFKPVPWWNLNGDLNFFRTITDGGNLGDEFAADDFTWHGRFTSRATLWKAWDVQVRFNYRAPRETTQGRNKAMYHADLGISRDIFQKKGTLTLSVRDLFNTRKRRYIIDQPGFYSEGEFQWRARMATLTLNYRLNQNKQRRQGRGNGEFNGEGGDFDGGEF